MRTAIILSIAAATWTLGPELAVACGGTPRVTPGEPAAGATDVPTNVVPWLWVNVADPAAEGVTLTLTDSTGMAVEADVTWLEGYVLAGYVVITPREELEPGAFYDILITGAETTTGESYYRFTTGSGPDEGSPPSVGELEMQLATNAASSSCGDNTFACVGVAHAGVVQLTVTREDGEVEAQMIVPVDGAVRYARTLSASAIPFCLELSARDVAGRLGPPSTICSSDAPTFDIDTTSPVTCSEHRVVYDEMFADAMDTEMPASGDDGGGCSAAGAPASSGALAMLLLLALTRRGRIRPNRSAGGSSPRRPRTPRRNGTACTRGASCGSRRPDRCGGSAPDPHRDR